MHNLGTVIAFEMVRTFKKASFWIAAFSIPAIFAAITGIIIFANQSTNERSDKIASESFSIAITDKSKLVSEPVIEATKSKVVDTEAAGIAAVKSGEVDAYFYYPNNPSDQPVKVYGKNVGIFENSRYETVAKQMLEKSVEPAVAPAVGAILSGTVSYQATMYDSNGDVDRGFMKFIIPGIFLVLFYFMIATFGNQMLTSVTEEKENRVIEMILTTIKPTTLLVGKLISLIALAFIQAALVIVPVIIGYLLFKEQLTLPNIDLAALPVDPERIIVGAVIFIASFLLLAGILMTVGAAMPTAKEAGSFFGVAMALLFGPLYAAPLFITSPDSPIVQGLTYFPLTAPIPLLLRNAVGNLTLPEFAIAITLLIAATVIVIAIGVRIFKFGALEYSRKLSFNEIIRRKN